jgi:hypothetical protein
VVGRPGYLMSCELALLYQPGLTLTLLFGIPG